MKTRQFSPDFIKGVAIVLMVYGHVTLVGTWAGIQQSAVDLIYTFHMPLFLVVSGFCLDVNLSIGEKTNKILRRLVVPYIVFASLYLTGLVAIRWTGIPANTPPPESILDGLRIIIAHPRGAYWFLHSLICIHVSILLARYLAERFRLGLGTMYIFAMFLQALLGTADILAPRTACFFMLGLVLGRLGDHLPNSLPIGGVITASIALFTVSDCMKFGFTQITWVLGILSLLAALAHVLNESKVANFLGWLGRNSLIILVVHAFFLVGLKPFSDIALRCDPSGVTYTVAVTTITLALSLLSAALIDRLGMSSLLFGTSQIYTPWSPRRS